MKRFLFIILFLSIGISQPIAQDSSRLRISLLTCTPGDELYSIFGHSALRVIDSNNVSDQVYNYGTFNFDDEGFYIKFIRGKLLYYVSLENFLDFQFAYQATGRGISEQVLALSGEEKQEIRRALVENLKEENKYYKYDFFFDNCTTRLRDIILKYKASTPQLPAVMPSGTRFREAIHEYLNKGGQQWSKFGIDILLGAPTDRVMTPAHQQFLPDNLLKALDSTTNTKLVAETVKLVNAPETGSDKSWFTPLLFFWALFSLVVMGSVLKIRYLQNIISRLDGLLFFLTGVLGIVLILMWTATDHSMTKNNFNLLWAVPTHCVAAFLVNRPQKWIKKYFLFTGTWYIIVTISWFFWPQQLNIALIPFVLLLAYRAISIHNHD